jgi:predicted small lipoprotein YifL
MNQSLRILAVLLLTSLAVAACGNKGDLVLPDPPAPVAAPAPPDTPPAK